MARAATYVNQINAGECGVACLNTVLAMRGSLGFLNKARFERLISSEGVTLLDIKRMAEMEGLGCEAHFVEPEELSELPLPAILHWNFNHFVVLLKVGSRYIVFDPSVGRMRLDPNQFSSSFTGYCLVFPSEAAPASPAPGSPPPVPSVTVLPTLLLSAVGAGLTVLLACFTGLLFRFMSANPVTLMGLMLACAFAGIAVIRFLCARLATDLLARSTEVAARRERADISERFARVPFYVTEAADPDEIKAVLSRRLANIDRRLRLRAEQPAAAFLIAASVVALTCFSPALAAVAILAAGGACAIKVALQHHLEMDSNATKLATGWAKIVLDENLRHADTLRSSGIGAQRFNLWRGRDEHFRTLVLEGAMEREGLEQLVELVRATAYLGFTFINVSAVMANVYGWPVMVTMGALFYVLFEAVAKLAGARVEQDRIDQDNLALDTLFPDASAPRQGAATAFAAPKDGNVTTSLYNVTFRRRKGARPVFENLSLEIRKGERVAIVGRSGVGKSTLVKMLAGLYPSDAGTVSRAGEIGERDALFLFQDLAVFRGSILENVCNFASDTDEARVWESLNEVGLGGVIQKLPLKLETIVTPNGPMSSGQLQRLSLARAIYLRPKLLVMDESTSHLDAETETRVMHALCETIETIIYVGHRPGILSQMDRLLALEAEGLRELSKSTPAVNATVEA